MNKDIVIRGATVAALGLCMAAAGAQVGQRSMLQAASEPASGLSAGVAGDNFTGDPQAKDDLLEGLDRLGVNAKERNEVNLDKNMLALAGGKKGGRYADLAQKMDFITVRNYEFASKGQYQKGDLDALRHKLDSNGWSHVVRNEDQDETNDIVVKADREGFISDMVILNAEAKELNIVHLRGHFRMEDVQGAMGSAMGISAGTFGIAGAMGHTGGTAHSEGPTPPSSPAPPADPALKKR